MKLSPSFISSIINSRFFITREYLLSALAQIAAIAFLDNKRIDSLELKSYKEKCESDVKIISETVKIKITKDFANENIEDESIAYHRVKGLIMAEDSYYGFSTKQFIKNIQAADANPRIMSHFIAVNSGGGEAWFLDVAAKAMKGLKKPSVAHYENVAASAGIYLSSPATKIYAATPNEIIGSIGTMVSFMDIEPMLQKWGIKLIEEYATQSNLKNKKYKDLKDGKPEQFIKEDLDPLAAQFIASVANTRPATAKLGFEHPVFRGETFDTAASIALGLIDGQMLMEEAIAVAYDLGKQHRTKQQQTQKLFSII